jgi:uncharacterized membrane protein
MIITAVIDGLTQLMGLRESNIFLRLFWDYEWFRCSNFK